MTRIMHRLGNINRLGRPSDKLPDLTPNLLPSLFGTLLLIPAR
jgi:hypothetical protein